MVAVKVTVLPDVAGFGEVVRVVVVAMEVVMVWVTPLEVEAAKPELPE
jgi:hypothetical protein